MDGYTYEQVSLEKNQIYSLYNVSKAAKKYKAKIFKNASISSYKLEETLEFNNQILWNMTHYSHILPLREVSVYESGEIHYYDNFNLNLKQYISMKPLSQEEAISILIDMMKAVFNLFQEGYYPRNLRPEHFVKSGQTWKIQSLVYQQEYQKYQGLDSEYVWSAKYQHPEAYSNLKLSEKELDESIVWNLGAIVLNMVIGSHILINLGNIKKFSKEGMAILQQSRFSKIGPLLRKMLNGNKLQRITIKQLYAYPLFDKQFDMAVLMHSFDENSVMVKDSSEYQQRSKIRSKINNLRREQSKIKKSKKDQLLFEAKFIGKQEPKLIQSYSPLMTSDQFYLLSSQPLLIKSVSQQQQEVKSPVSSGLVNSRQLPIHSKKEIIQNPVYEQQNAQQQQMKQFQFEMLQSSIVKKNKNKKQNPKTKSPVVESIKQQQQESIMEFPNFSNVDSVMFSHKKVKQQSEMTNPILRLLNKYKEQIDKCDLLQHVSTLTSQIPYKTNPQQNRLLVEYMILFCSITYMYPLVKSLNINLNYFNVNLEIFSEFQETTNFNFIKIMSNQSLSQKTKTLEKLRIQVNKIDLKNLGIGHVAEIKNIIKANPKEIVFHNQLKLPYRTVLTPAYKLISHRYNQYYEKRMMVLGTYIVFALAIDKLFIPEDIQDNFTEYFKWRQVQRIPILLNEIKFYIENAGNQSLVKQARYILQKYYNI